ncbi:MAG: VWA domain-containing protein [Lachnospiraceae bacterium]|nr:VWA domain-containing protein [Lachnospiraceae bacterium]
MPVPTMTTIAATEVPKGGNMDFNYSFSESILADNMIPAEAPDFSLKEDFNTEEYNSIKETGFLSTLTNPLSTFSADVDTASYTNVRRMLNDGAKVDGSSIRLEEFLNYFSYDYKTPTDGAPFGVTTELADCPWNPNSKLLLIGLQAEEINFENRPASNFVFLLDVSGSMNQPNKLPLMQKAFAMLAESLTENDRVSIVTYAGSDSVLLEGVAGNELITITSAIESLEAAGSTAGSAGINTAYKLAEKYFIPGGNNRIILATDGDLNVGVTSEAALTDLITKKRESEIYLSVLGFGTGNIKDNKMEALADNGNGNYSYIDSIFEAKKVLVNEMGGTLYTVAKDVKLQVEFNPAKVAKYRLIGYENRKLQDYEFNDDTVDAGEIGAGHSVTAVYELILTDSDKALSASEYALKYQTATLTDSDDLLTLSIRYKEPDADTSKLLEYPVLPTAYSETMPDNLKFAACVLEFGMLLRESEYKGTSSYDSILTMLSELGDYVKEDAYKEEFRELVKLAQNIPQ